MRPNIPNQKPTTGRLWYGSRVIVENKPFRTLQSKKTNLIEQGYDKKLFRISY